jgi:hypothetical protein
MGLGVYLYLRCARRRALANYVEPLLTGTERAAAAANERDSEGAARIGWYSGLDSRAFAAMQTVDARLALATPIGTPIGSTPAGNYVGLYAQYGLVHPIPAQQLACTPSNADGTHGTVTGFGHDDVGQFTVHGQYANSRMALRKQYIRGTGNPNENFGHSVLLRLTRCELAAALPSHMHVEQWGVPHGHIGFVGTWHVRTAGYRGDAEMCLWLPPVPVVVGHVISESRSPSTGIGSSATTLLPTVTTAVPVVSGTLVE